jgi:Domain of unknown function (DUF5655)/Domain of unknown function (DUF4287)
VDEERNDVSTPDDGLQAQLRNIEASHGRTIDEWIGLIAASGTLRHTEVVALLERDHGLPHGAAHRLSIVARARLSDAGDPATEDFAATLYTGRKASLRPIHHRLMTALSEFGPDIEEAPKKGYVSLRRAKQFAMIKPGGDHVNVGLILGAVPTAGRLEPAAGFNALFTHRVRVRDAEEVDAELLTWLRTAYDRAGSLGA